MNSIPGMAIYRQAIEEELRRIVTVPEGRADAMYRMMQYHLGWTDRTWQSITGRQGKRVRPLMCLLACEATSGTWDQALPAAAALELIHNFTLIHDDIQDNSLRRHGRDTVWHVWGLAQGINTGDGMWALAQAAVHRLHDQGRPAETVLAVSRLLSESCLSLCAGQHLDIRYESLATVSLDDYLEMVRGKTAALLGASCAAGAILGEAEHRVAELYRAFGTHLGLAYQMVDDILGIWGDAKTTGKPVGSDILARKKSLPIVHALTWEQRQGRDDLFQLYQRTELRERHVGQALDVLEQAGSKEFTRKLATAELAKATSTLEATGIDHPAQDSLAALAYALTHRSA
jgi:geranylgeranyl diphosphate synthase, type I